MAPRIAEDLGGVEGVDELAGLVELAAPARPIQDVLVDQARHEGGSDGEVDPDEQARIDAAEDAVGRIADPGLAPDTGPGELLGAPGTFWLDLRGYDPVAAAVDRGLPVLVLLAGRDYGVHEADVEAWRSGAEGAGDVTVEVLPSLDHLLVPGEGESRFEDYAAAGRVSPELLDRVAVWMEDQTANA
ncbi:MAG: hypothetical protein U5R31_06405 [Acidimicrobiia bacterium]|nr:hypothetical protein [Acidimicrobiia bacterium]